MTEVLSDYVPVERARRRPLAVVGVAVAVVLTLGAGAFAAVSFAATEGSASPEAAVEELVAAVEQADVVGILESLTPGERDSLQPGLEGLAGELARLGVLEADFELGPVNGLGADVEGLQLSSAPLGEGVSAVTVEAGTITTTTDLAALPLGPLLRILLADAEPPADVMAEDLAGPDGSVIVAVEEGGRWHVSLWYTIAEAARRDSGKAAPAFGAGVAPRAADSPETAVSGAVDAALDLDAAGVIALLDPDEARALHDYAPLFLPDLDRAAQEAADAGYDLELDRLDTTVDRSDGSARVTVEGFAVSGRVPDEGAVSLAFDGACFTFESEVNGSREQCLDQMTPEGAGSDADDPRLQLTAVERGDGEWYLSPTRTVLDGLVAGLAGTDAGDLTDLGASLGGLFGQGLLGAAVSGSSEGSSATELAPAEPSSEGAAGTEGCAAAPEQAPASDGAEQGAGWSPYDACTSGHAEPVPATTAVPAGG